MKKTTVFVLLILAGVFPAKAQKVFNEGSVKYTISMADESQREYLKDASQVVYLKGTQNRIDMVTSLGSTVTIQDSKSGDGVMLYNYGDQKILVKMKKEDFGAKNKKYDGVRFDFTDDTKEILGYKCQKVVAHLNDGTSLNLFVTKELVPATSDFAPWFKGINGLVLEFETQVRSSKITFVASNITFDNIQSSTFEIPKSGYREMTYEESKRISH